MKRLYKPADYPSVSAYLAAREPQKIVDFLKKTFNAVVMRRFDRPDGSIMHIEVRVHDSIVMIGGVGDDWEPQPAMVHVYVEDVDRTFKAAVAAGGEVIAEPVRKDGDPDKRGGVKDPCGNQWWIGTMMVEQDEMKAE